MIEHLLNRTAAVSRRMTIGDGGGGRAAAWLPVGTPRCRVSQPHPVERERAGQSGADLEATVYFAPAADVRRGDRLDVDGDELEVVAVFSPSEAIYLRADCRRRQGEEPL